MKRRIFALLAVAACSSAIPNRKSFPLDLEAIATLVKNTPAHNVFAHSDFRVEGRGFRFRNVEKPLENIVVDAPALSDGVFHAASGGVRRVGIDLSFLDGRPRPAELLDGRLVYRDVLPSADLLVTASATRLEQFVVLRDESAPRSLRWRIQGGSALQAHENPAENPARWGGVEFVDAREESQVTLLPIAVVDGAGERVAARAAFADGVLTVEVPAGLRYPVVVDPALETGKWVQRTDVAPAPMLQESDMISVGWDPVNNRVLALGEDSYNYHEYTLSLIPGVINNQWVVAHYGGNNSVVAHYLYDPLRNNLVYYPGRGKILAIPIVAPFESALSNSLLEWGGNDVGWTKISTAHYPPKDRRTVAMAYDELRGVLVTYGGYWGFYVGTAQYASNETWEYDGTDWKKVDNAGGDFAIYAGLAYDSVRNKVVLGCATSSGLNTYELESGKWVAKSPAHRPSTASSDNVNMVFDPFRKRTVIVVGSSTYEWDGTDWALMASVSPVTALLYDANRKRVLGFGGTSLSSVWEYFRRGAGCTTTATCDSGFCVDGVCCETNSCDECSACNLAGSEGMCAHVDAADTATCGGAQGCVLGVCKTKLGKTCTVDTQCASGNCVDGVCCDGPCKGLCRACTAATKASGADDGACGYAKAGLNPHKDACTVQTPATCGTDGTCDGAGACRKHIPGTACGTAECLGSAANGQLCDGAGNCKLQKVACSPGYCNEASCKLDCTRDEDCDPEKGFCDNGFCIGRLAPPAPCTRDAQCSSRACVDGVCCGSRCAGQCEACDVEGSVGVCVPVKGGPHGGRSACATVETTKDACAVGACDGDTRTSCSGFPGPDTACRPASCTNDVATIAGDCNSKGTCASAQTKPCTPYGCAGDACATQCASDAECAANATCSLATKTCILGKTCDGDHTLKAADGDIDCAPYKCEGATCRAFCRSVEGCVSPTVCSADGKCVAPTSNGDDSSGCAMTPRSPVGGGLACAVGVAALALLARRRRAQ